MLEVDPSRRISCAEVWSLIDSLNDKHKDPQNMPNLIQFIMPDQQQAKQQEFEIALKNYCDSSDKPSSE